MSPPSIPTHLDRLRAERRSARHRALAYAGGGALVAAIGAIDLVGRRAAITAALCGLAAALWWLAIERRAVASRRVILDDLILHGWRTVAPAAVAEREDELLARRNRRLLARALENQVVGTFGQAPVYSQHQRLRLTEIRRHGARIRAVAGRLRDDQHPVDPRAVVLVTQLLSDGTSPIHTGPMQGLEPALERIEQVLAQVA
jgi:hypothetical protein